MSSGNVSSSINIFNALPRWDSVEKSKCEMIHKMDIIMWVVAMWHLYGVGGNIE